VVAKLLPHVLHLGVAAGPGDRQLPDLHRRHPVDLEQAGDTAEAQEHIGEVEQVVAVRASCVAIDLRRFVCAEQVAEDIDVVDGEVEDHVRVSDLRRHDPDPAGEDRDDVTHVAPLDTAFELADGRVEALHVTDCENDLVLLGERDHAVGLLRGRRDRLLDQDVLPRGEQ